MKTPPLPATETLKGLSVGFLAIHLATDRRVWIWVALVLLVLPWLVPSAAARLATGWSRLLTLLATFLTRILLGLVYFLVLTPLGWAWRHVRKDPLGLRRPSTEGSLWTIRGQTYTPSDMQKPW